MPIPTPTRVLVVDDERFFREAIRELLEAEGIAVRLAPDAADALEGAADPLVGVVVLDIQLPDRSGLEVLRLLRERRPALRVVMLSAHTDQEYVLEALRLGACDYLAKPLHEEEMRLSVRRALEAYDLATKWSALRGRLGLLAGEVERLVSDGADAEPGARASQLAEAAARLLDAGKTSVMLREPAGDQLRVAAVTGRKLVPEEFDAVPIGGGVAGRAVAQGEAILVDDASTDPRFASEAAERYESGSFVVMPLGRGADAFGALCVTDRRGGARFGEDDVALLRLMALAASPLLDPTASLLEADGYDGIDTEFALGGTGPASARSPQRAEGERSSSSAQASEVNRRGALQQAAPDPDSDLARAVCDAMTREVEPERVLRSALQAVGEQLGAAPTSVYLLDPTSDALRREAQWESDGPGDREALPRSVGLTGSVFETGQAVACGAPEEDPRFAPAVDTPEGERRGPLLVLPLRFRGKTLGVFRAFPATAGAATPRTAEVLGAALSAAVRNVLLYRSLVESIEEVAQVRREARSSGAH